VIFFATKFNRGSRMADDVSIKFTADVSDLQRGMQQATSAVEATTGALRNGATQISSSFASLAQASASNASRSLATTQASGDTELAIARQNEQGRYDIAVNGAKLQSALVKEQAQTGQISRQEELASLLSLAQQQEDVEARHLEVVRGTYQQGTTAYTTAQRQIDELASQSALRRQQIESSVGQQIYADYRRTYDQVGSSVTSSIMGMIRGHQSLRQSAQTVALSIVQSFLQARVKMVADWLAGVAAQTTATTVGETAKTAAVVAGVGARSAAESTGGAASSIGMVSNVLKSISASAGETFAGIFGFLAPVMGPAAAGPAAAGEATVLGMASGLASFAVGAWNLPSDMIAQVHQGEMIVPAGPAAAMRSAISSGGAAGTVNVQHATHFNISAIDAAGVKNFFNNNSKQILRTINEGVRTGSHLGMSKLKS
jgi:hypothetical protein